MNTVTGFLKKQMILILMILIFILAALTNDNFLTNNNMYGLMIQLPAYGMAALALTFCLICGELNISMGSIMAFAGVIFAIVIERAGFAAAWLVTLGACAVLGIITGISVAYWKIDSFVATLSMMTFIRGLALFTASSKPVMITNPAAVALGITNLGTVPVITILFVIIVVILEYVLKYTIFGRNLYAVGGNAEIAGSIGIKVQRYKFSVFVIFSVLSAIGGIFLAVRMNTGSPIIGEDAPLSTIPMAIVGGTALSGGRGGAVRTFIGVLFMSLLFNVMQIFGMPLNIQTFAKGLILLGIIVWDKYNANKWKKV